MIVCCEIHIKICTLLNGFNIEIGLQPSAPKLKFAAGHRIRFPDNHVRNNNCFFLLIEVNLKDSPIVGLSIGWKLMQ